METVRTESSTNQKFQHDHPDFKNILKMMNECNIIKYAAYRTAAKLGVLRRALHMDTVQLGLIAGVFDRHHLRNTENGVVLKYTELEAVIFDIFFATQKENMSDIDVDLTTELTLNLLLNIYDGKQSGSLQVLPVKVALTVLSSANLQKKYQYLFSQLADHNNCISSNKFEILLKNLICIAEYLNESAAFGHKFITSAVESCFLQSQSSLGLTEDMFIGWLLHEPQLLVWLSTMYRMQVAEMVSHSVKCGVCKVYPIVGLRYQCLDCLRYNLCQTCFFMTRVSKKHKLRHRMQEHCYEASSRETIFAFLKVLKKKLCGNSSELQYLSVQPCDMVWESSHSTSNVPTQSSVLSGQTESGTSTSEIFDHSKMIQPHKELQSIISQLEEENRYLQQTVNKLSGNKDTVDMCECLQFHYTHVETQVERLKLLKQYLLERHPQQRQCVQSTPLLKATQENRETSCFTDISPIIKDAESNRQLAGMRELQLLMWQMKNDRQTNRSDADGMETTAVSERQSSRSDTDGIETTAVKDRETKSSDTDRIWTTAVNDLSLVLPSVSDISVRDLSTWVGGRTFDSVDNRDPSRFSVWVQEFGHCDSEKRVKEMHGDLDGILQKLQEMLASNFSLEESFSSRDNAQLQQGAQELEYLITGLINSIESKKGS